MEGCKKWFWSKEEDQYILDNYQCCDYRKIALALNRTFYAVGARIRSLGLEKVPLWNGSQDKFLKSHYSDKNWNFLIDNLHKTRGAIIRRAGRLGLRRSRNKYWRELESLSISDKLDAPLAYFLGFFAADGNIHGGCRNNSVCLFLNEKDRYIIEFFLGLFNLSTSMMMPLDKLGKFWGFRFSSAKLKQWFLSYGIVPCKSLILKFPQREQIYPYEKQFILGYLDGDGCISYRVGKRKSGKVVKYLDVSLAGTEDFLSHISQILSEILGIGPRRIRKYGNIFIMNYYSQDSKKICSWLYDNPNTLFLKRKYKKYLELSN